MADQKDKTGKEKHEAARKDSHKLREDMAKNIEKEAKKGGK